MSTTIQSLPVEMLQNIFDHLDGPERRKASRVCRQWHQVAWSDRYVRRMTVTVTKENLCSRRILQWMRHRPFRKLNIEDHCLNAPEQNQFIVRIRKLLASKKIRLNVQELRLLASHRFLNDILGQRHVGFPVLQEIIFSPGSSLMPHEDVAPAIDVHVPNLTVLKIDVFTNAAVELVRLASRQIRSLSMRFVDKDRLLHVLGIGSFDALQYAGLFAVPSGCYFERLRASDFLPTHKATLAKLDSLEIRDSVNMFGHVYDSIFRGATNLSQLHVSGVDMSPSALASIHDMKKLRRLHLYIFSLAPETVLRQ